jgi:hypothetical protein
MNSTGPLARALIVLQIVNLEWATLREAAGGRHIAVRPG